VPMPFCRPDRLLAPTWTLTAGSPLEGYGLEQLVDGDPSYPLRIAEPSIGLRGDLGAPRRVDGLAVIHHNFAPGVVVRVRIGATPGGADYTLTQTVGAWPGRFARHLYFDLAAALPLEADRTRQYLRLDNTSPNPTPVAIGELVTAGQVETFSGILVDAKAGLTFGRTLVDGKKGPQYIHDRRTRDRLWTGAAILENAADIAAYDGLQQTSYGVLPFLIWPLNSLEDEPIFARFVEPGYEATLPVDLTIANVAIAVRELACGEAY
jgi:hypothetical protein